MIYFEHLWAYLALSAPYLLLGFFISGIMHVFIPMEKVKKWLGAQNVRSVFKAALVGIPLPLCSCSVIPAAATLRKSGASNGATSAFLISTPESGIDSISITYGLMDLPMTILRPVAAFFSSFVAGICQIFFNDFDFPQSKVENKNEQVSTVGKETKDCHGEKDNKYSKPFFRRFFDVFNYGFGNLSNDISKWLTIGLFLGALIDLFVPEGFFANMAGTQSKVMILIIGVPFYICASSSTPIALSLMLKGLSPGNALLFLLVGPATNITNIFVMQKYIGKKGVIINIASIIVVALIFSFLADYLYTHLFPLNFSEAIFNRDHHFFWWENISAFFLLFLLLKGIYFEEIKPRLNKSGHAKANKESGLP